MCLCAGHNCTAVRYAKHRRAVDQPPNRTMYGRNVDDSMQLHLASRFPVYFQTEIIDSTDAENYKMNFTFFPRFVVFAQLRNIQPYSAHSWRNARHRSQQARGCESEFTSINVPFCQRYIPRLQSFEFSVGIAFNWMLVLAHQTAHW